MSRTVVKRTKHSPKQAGLTGRNEFLQGLRKDVYDYVLRHPGCTRKDVTNGLSIVSSSATARIKELIDEGYVFEPFGEKKRNGSGVKARRLYVDPDRKQSKQPRDRVAVKVEIKVDALGNYYANASVVDGCPLAASGGTRTLHTKIISISVPSDDELGASDESASVEKFRMSKTELNKGLDDGLTITVDYSTV